MPTVLASTGRPRQPEPAMGSVPEPPACIRSILGLLSFNFRQHFGRPLAAGHIFLLLNFAPCLGCLPVEAARPILPAGTFPIVQHALSDGQACVCPRPIRQSPPDSVASTGNDAAEACQLGHASLPGVAREPGLPVNAPDPPA